MDYNILPEEEQPENPPCGGSLALEFEEIPPLLLSDGFFKAPG